MRVQSLERLLRPRSVAVIGATDREDAVGHLVMRNLLSAGFEGPVMPVHPEHRSVAGVLSYPSVAALPATPDLAVICTPPETVPETIAALGARGVGAAVVITSGLAHIAGEDGETLQARTLALARQHGLRLLGPNCLGLQVPAIGLNASFAHATAMPGKIAFLSQSGALCTVVLDWARTRGIGFSHFVSMGDSADVDFGDLIDFLGSEPETRAILLYIESIRERRNFMSAARAAARNKPVIVIKSGRNAEGARAAETHTGALAGADAVYDAAIRRAGMLRVLDIDELFGAVETLARARPVAGNRLAIVSNGGGIGVMAVDALVANGGTLATLDPATLAALDRVLPATWSRANPIDIIGDAGARRYADTLTALAGDRGIDAVLVLHAPTAAISSDAAARAVVEAARGSSRPILTSWVGGDTAASGRRAFAEAGLPTYDTPERAVRAFTHMVNYQRNQNLLMETPASLGPQTSPALETARLIIEHALARGETMLAEPDAKAVLAAFGVPTVETHIARNGEEAAQRAQAMGFPVALKILSPDITHKSEIGGVDLFLETPASVRAAADTMLNVVRARRPDARIEGFSVQKMATRSGAFELLVGVASDPVFGPVILFGHGGTAVEVIGDRAVGLPPLNATLADDLIGRTRVARLLEGFRDRPPADLDAIRRTLIQVSQLVIDLPEVVELDVNPLLADAKGVVAVDARIRIAPAGTDGERRLAIRPYPKALEETFHMPSGRVVLLRPIRPEDEPEHYEFLRQVTPEDIRFRFFGLVKELPHSQMARFTQIDYDREMAFIATAPREDARGNETLGVVRTMTDPDNARAEFAILVRSDIKAQGLGHRLLKKMIDYCRARGTRQIVGQVLSENARMLELAQALGFRRRAVPNDQAVEVTLDL